jgi:hypothetical protein
MLNYEESYDMRRTFKVSSYIQLIRASHVIMAQWPTKHDDNDEERKREENRPKDGQS